MTRLTSIVLSIILTAATVFPDMSGETIVSILVGGSLLAVVGYAGWGVLRRTRDDSTADDGLQSSKLNRAELKEIRASWRMPSLDQLPPAQLTLSNRIWMGVLRGYLVVAVALVVVKVVQSALA